MAEADTMTDEEYLDFLREQHYIEPRILPTGKWAAILPLFYTHAIVTGEVGDVEGYSDRWCYDYGLAALAALTVWDGEGEPKGWHRHPSTGRRIARVEGEYDERGNLVPMGQMYIAR